MIIFNSKKIESFKNYIKKACNKIKEIYNKIKEKYNNKIFNIMIGAQVIFNLIVIIMLICSLVMTNNLTKQLNDISNQNTSVTSSVKPEKPVDTNSKADSVESTSSDASTSSTSTTSSTPSTLSKSTTSKTTVNLPTSKSDTELLACVIYQEAGSDYVCDKCRRRVADVVLNRVADDRFPNTVNGVLTAKNQYGRYYYTGVVWPSRAKNASEQHAVERAYRVAEEVLNGQHSDLYGNGYIWQAGFKQGSGTVKCCGIYFGK